MFHNGFVIYCLKSIRLARKNMEIAKRKKKTAAGTLKFRRSEVGDVGIFVILLSFNLKQWRIKKRSSTWLEPMTST